MQHGFKKVVVELVRAHPGLTAEEYARMALEKGLAGSDSADPVFSLQTTLRKEVREDRMPEITAQKVNGKLHYFPVGKVGNAGASSALTPAPGIQPHPPVSLTVPVPSDIVGELDLLVDLNKAGNRSEALVRLARAGIEAKRAELDRARDFNQRAKKERESFGL